MPVFVAEMVAVADVARGVGSAGEVAALGPSSTYWRIVANWSGQVAAIMKIMRSASASECLAGIAARHLA